MSRPVLPALALLAAVAATAQDAPKPARTPEQLRAFYAEHCARCHGADGSARDAQGRSLKGKDFTDARAMAREKDEGLVKAILSGRRMGLAMPAFKDRLSAEEARAMVVEVVRKAKAGQPIGTSEP